MISQTHPVNWYVVDFSRDEMTDGMRLSQRLDALKHHSIIAN